MHRVSRIPERVSESVTDELVVRRAGKVRYAAAAWLLGLPLPIILLALIFRGCDW